MDTLKEILFNETLYHTQEYLRLKKKLGEWDSLVDTQHSKFVALYTVIENAHLEEEYQNWKGAQKSEHNENH